jgi:PhnB protein
MESMNTTTAAHGKYTHHGVPHGFTSLTPFIVVSPARDAIAFYRDAFSATLTQSTEFPGPDGTQIVAHAELDFGSGRLQLGDPSPQYGLVPRQDTDADCYSLALYVADIDATFDRAVELGATVREAPQTFASGDRFASIRDPYGIRWSVLTRVEDLSDEESAARVAEWAAQQG